MKATILTFLATSALAFSASLVVVEGGVSSDKRLAVAVVPQKEGEFIDEANDAIFLIDNRSKKRIGRLEEVSSSGGTWGKTTTNVDAAWSPDGRHLIVNYRTGRLMHGHQLYRIAGRRAIPLTLKRRFLAPKSKILDVLGHSANPGATLKWNSDGTLAEYAYGYMPKEGRFDEDYSKYGLPDFDGTLKFLCRHNRNGRWELFDIRTPKDE